MSDEASISKQGSQAAPPPHQEAGGLGAGASGTPVLRVVLVAPEGRARDALARRLGAAGHRVAVCTAAQYGELPGEDAPETVVLWDLDAADLAAAARGGRAEPDGGGPPVVGMSAHRAGVEAGETEDRIFACLEKPVEVEELLDVLLAAVRARRRSSRMAAPPRSTSRWRVLVARLWGQHGFRPGLVALGVLCLVVLWFVPAPAALTGWMARQTPRSGSTLSPAARWHAWSGLAGEAASERTKRVPVRFPGAASEPTGAVDGGAQAGRDRERASPAAQPGGALAVRAARAALVSLVLLALSVLFWASGALPVAFTSVLGAAGLLLFGVVTPARLADICFNDAVLLVFGVLALAQCVVASGLDRRIGSMILARGGVAAVFWVGVPLLALWASFLPELLLVACVAPFVLRAAVLTEEGPEGKGGKRLAGALLLALCFAANLGGPGSPVAGGRNALMLALLADYGVKGTVADWIAHGLPFVPVAGLAVGVYFWLRVRRSAVEIGPRMARTLAQVRSELGPWRREEILVGGVLVMVAVLWLAAPGRLGLSGPPLLGLSLLAVLRAARWREVSRLSWDVVLLYAAASGLGAAMAHTGAGAWIASEVGAALPDTFARGPGLLVAAGLGTGVLTNFMNDGAAVAAVGPVVLPLAQASGTSLWLTGLVTAFASSFANVLLVATPTNAVIYALARDPRSGARLLTLRDFVVHGLAVTAIAFALLYGWAVFGYWRWI